MGRKRKRLPLALVVSASAAVATGCASLDPHKGIPSAPIADRARVPGMRNIRFWADSAPQQLGGVLDAYKHRFPRLSHSGRTADGRPIVHVIAFSGGGGDGAFGAGLLAGWSRRGDRPTFDIVTGVSAGAIIAPFVFLGQRYDANLERIWTEYRADQVAIQQMLPGILGGPSLYDTAPLVKIVELNTSRELMREIAREYRKGRLLLVATTNLDAQRPVIWDLGAIAAKDSDEGLALFRKVILASAAIPAVFPPVRIDVEADGRHYDELHVDGGATHEVFIAPTRVPLAAYDSFYDAPPYRKIYVVTNGKSGPEQEIVTEQALTIGTRSLSTLIKMQNRADVYRSYRMAVDAKADFNFLAIPDDFAGKPKDIYDPVYQRALFDEGSRIGRRGGPWYKAPPAIRIVGRS